MLRKVWMSFAIGLLLLVMTFEYVEVSFSPKLRNMAAVVGSKMKISCVSNSSERVYWYRVKNKVTDAMKKINNVSGIILPDFSNFVATGEITGETLETNSIRSENAGLLQCKTAGKEFDAQLTVLDTEPTCNVILVTNELPTRAELYCSVGYNGFWTPTMEWIRLIDNTKIGGHLNISANKVILTMQVNTDNADVSSEYDCRTFFSNETRPESGAANIPDYDFSCSAKNMASTPVANDDGSNASGGYVIWVITGFAGAACIVVLAVIIVFLKRNPEVCRKSTEPDIMQLADVVQNADINMVMENQVNNYREDEVDEEPEQPGGVLYQNRVYAEVEVCDRELPPYMYDSPAWSGSSGNKKDCRGKAFQYSPACSHQSRTGTPRNAASRCGTPRSESPNIAMENVEYLDINSVATIPTPQMQRTQQQMPRRPPARLPTTSNKFQPAMYASIDHTSRPPPPLPPNDEY